MIPFLVRAVLSSRRLAPAYLFAAIWMMLASAGGAGLIGPLILLFCTVPAAIARVSMTFDEGGLNEILDAYRGYTWSLVYRLAAASILTSPVLILAVLLSGMNAPDGIGGALVGLDAMLCLGGCQLGATGLASLSHPKLPGGLGLQVVGFCLALVALILSPPFQALLSGADGRGLTSSLIALAVGCALAIGPLGLVPRVLVRVS